MSRLVKMEELKLTGKLYSYVVLVWIPLMNSALLSLSCFRNHRHRAGKRTKGAATRQGI